MPGKIHRFLNLHSAVFLLVGASSGATTSHITGTIDSNAALGLLGVIFGSILTAFISWLIAKKNRKLQWALAALDKRLEVQQAAYSEWKKIMGAVCGGDEILKTVLEAEKWWNKNCLYLDPVSREAFRECVFCVFKYQEYLEKTHYTDVRKKKREIWNTIMRPGRTLPEGVTLRHFEKKELSPEHAKERE